MMRLEDIRAARFARGARGPHRIDCLGVVMIGAAQLGHPFQDPWGAFLEQWHPGRVVPDGPGLPDSWQRIPSSEAPRDGDVWLWHGGAGRPPGCGIVYQGRVWSANPAAGVVSLAPDAAAAADEVWRP